MPIKPEPPVIKIRISKLLLDSVALHIQWPYGKARVLSGESMRVLHVIPFVALRHGGSTHAIRKITSACVEFASRVTVLTGEALSSPDILSGFHPAVEVVAAPGPIERLERISPATIRYLSNARNAFDVIHVHTQFNFTVTAASWVARFTGYRYHSSDWDPRSGVWPTKLGRNVLTLTPSNQHVGQRLFTLPEHERSSITALGFGDKLGVPLCARRSDRMYLQSQLRPREILFMSRWDAVANRSS